MQIELNSALDDAHERRVRMEEAQRAMVSIAAEREVFRNQLIAMTRERDEADAELCEALAEITRLRVQVAKMAELIGTEP